MWPYPWSVPPEDVRSGSARAQARLSDACQAQHRNRELAQNSNRLEKRKAGLTAAVERRAAWNAGK